jgi:hypothetical protein
MYASLNQHPVFQDRRASDDPGILGSVSEPKSDARDDPREAYKRLRSNQCWTDWRTVIIHLARGSAAAMKVAHTNERKGRRYCEEYSAWLEAEGFADLSKTTRHNALKCADHLDEIKTFLAGLKPDDQLRLNHPASVLAAWKRKIAKPTEPSEKPKPLAMEAAWAAASAEEHTQWVQEYESQIFGAMTPAQRQRITNAMLRLHNKMPKFDDEFTDLFEKACLHVEHGTPDEAIAANEAIACLRAVLRKAEGRKLKITELKVGVSVKTKQKPI